VPCPLVNLEKLDLSQGFMSSAPIGGDGYEQRYT